MKNPLLYCVALVGMLLAFAPAVCFGFAWSPQPHIFHTQLKPEMPLEELRSAHAFAEAKSLELEKRVEEAIASRSEREEYVQWLSLSFLVAQLIDNAKRPQPMRPHLERGGPISVSQLNEDRRFSDPACIIRLGSASLARKLPAKRWLRGPVP